jgi:DNA polymerase III sliding clamp (beta) subunit (PCNA family)
MITIDTLELKEVIKKFNKLARIDKRAETINFLSDRNSVFAWVTAGVEISIQLVKASGGRETISIDLKSLARFTLNPFLGDSVNLDLPDKKDINRIVITSGKARQTYIKEQNDGTFNPGATSYTLDTDIFKAGLKVIAAASYDETRPIFQAVYIKVNGSANFTAADTFQLFNHTAGENLPELPVMKIHAPYYSLFCSLIKGESTIEIGFSGKETLILRAGNLTFVTENIPGNYPNLSSIIATYNQVKVKYLFNRSEFLKALNWFNLFAVGENRTSPFKIQLTKTTAQLTQNHDGLETSMTIATSGNRNNYITAFQLRFLINALRQFSSDTIEFSCYSASAALYLRGLDESDKFKACIMPMHVLAIQDNKEDQDND